MKIAVLGGSRLIGSHLIPALVKNFAGGEIHVINRGVTPPAWDYDKAARGRVKRHIADRSTPLAFGDSLEKIADLGFDAVIDCSCYSKDELTPAVRAFARKIKQYIFISTASVYGDLHYVPADEKHPIDNSENNSMYGREKIKCEKELLYSAKNGDFKVTILRPTYIYGPFDHTRRLFYLIDRIYHDVPIFIPAEGNDPLFNAVYVGDLAEQIRLSVMNEAFFNETFNAASNDSILFSDFLKLIGNCFSREVKIIYVSRDEYKKAASGQSFPYTSHQCAFDCAKMKLAVGEDRFPKTSYNDGIYKTIEWHRAHGEFSDAHSYEAESEYFKKNFTGLFKSM